METTDQFKNSKKIIFVRNKETGRTYVCVSKDLHIIRNALKQSARRSVEILSETKSDFYVELNELGVDAYDWSIVGEASTSTEARNIKNYFINELSEKGLDYNQFRKSNKSLKNMIYADNTRKVVVITNTRNEKVYVSISESITQAKQSLINRSKIKDNQLGADVVEFGLDSFNFEIVFETLDHNEAVNKKRELVYELSLENKTYNYHYTANPTAENSSLLYVIFIKNPITGETYVTYPKSETITISILKSRLKKGTVNPRGKLLKDFTEIGLDNFEVTTAFSSDNQSEILEFASEAIENFRHHKLSYNIINKAKYKK